MFIFKKNIFIEFYKESEELFPLEWLIFRRYQEATTEKVEYILKLIQMDDAINIKWFKPVEGRTLVYFCNRLKGEKTYGWEGILLFPLINEKSLYHLAMKPSKIYRFSKYQADIRFIGIIS